MTDLRALLRRPLRRGVPPSIDRTAWFQQRWRDAASSLGWTEEWCVSGRQCFVHDGCRAIVHESDTGLDSRIVFRMAGDKTLTATLLDRAAIPHPPSTTHEVTRPRRLAEAISRLGDRAVVKPAAGTGSGRGVTVGPVGSAQIARAIADAAGMARKVVVQERLDGDVVRVLVVDGRVVDVVLRHPAAVVGDGQSTVAELVEAENERRAALGPDTTGFVPTGADHLVALASVGLRPESVPTAGRSVTVAGRSNTGSERESHRVMLSPAAEAMAARAAEIFGIRVAGVDLVVDDRRDPVAVLEINTGPGLHWHLLVDGQPFDAFVVALQAWAAGRS